jgi:predicted Zn-dependent peptidase
MGERRRTDPGLDPTMFVGGPASPAGEPDAAAPERIGRYRLLGELGRGGMGVVYRAHDEDLDRPVALKVLGRSLAGEDERLRREARALARLSHPNVVTVHQVGAQDGTVFIAMELVSGRSLRAWLADRPDWRERLAAFRQAGEGLRAAHAAGLVHRDFKPDNAVVGDDGRVRVLDFGLARPAAPGDGPAVASGAPSALTQTGSIVGTPAYMAPEQWLGAATDARTDQFAFAAALYEALHGSRPFRGETLEELSAAVLAGAVEPVPAGSPVPDAVRRILLRGLAREPAARFASMAELLAALDAASRPPSRSRRRRQRWLALAGALGFAAAAVVADQLRSTAPPADPIAAMAVAADLPATLSEPLPDDPMAATVHRLSSGLTVYLSPNRHAPRVQAWIVFRVGSRHDPPGKSGLGHLLEHMLFKGGEALGTTDFAAESPHLERLRELYRQLATAAPEARRDLLARIDAETVAASRFAVANDFVHTLHQLGATSVNGWVRSDYAIFATDLPSNRLEAWARLEAERWRRPVFRLFHAELASVLEELRRQHDAARPGSALYGALFAGHPYAIPGIGTVEDLLSEPYLDLEEHHRRWFVPHNAAVVLAGDVAPGPAIALLEQAFAGWEPRPVPPLERRAPPPLVAPGVIDLPSGGERLALVGWRTVPTGHPDEAPLEVMDWVFRKAIAPRLEVDGGLVAALESSLDGRGEAGAWTIAAAPWSEQPIARAIEAVDRAVAALVAGDFSAAEFAALAVALRVDEARQLEDNGRRAQLLAESFIRREEWKDGVARRRRTGQVSREDVMRVARQYLGGARVIVRTEPGPQQPLIIDRPAVTPLDLDPTRQSPLGRELARAEVMPVEPRFLRAGRHFQRVETPRGPLTVAPSAAGELFALHLVYPFGGRAVDGLCEALSAAATAGAGDHRRASDRQAAWRQLGLTVEIDCWADQVEVRLDGPDAALPDAVREVTAGLGAPRWEQDDWARARRSIVEERRARRGREPWLADALGDRLAHGPDGSYLGEPGEAAIEDLRSEAAVAALGRMLGARRRAAYFGPRDAAEVAGLLAWPDGPAVDLGSPPREVERRRRGQALHLDRPGSSATTGMLALPLSRPSSEDWVALELWKQVLEARLYDELREGRGLTFGARLALRDPVPGAPAVVLEIQLTGSPDTMGEALARAIELMRQAPAAPAIAAGRGQLEERYRTDWLAPRDVAPTVARWFDLGHGGDPRPARFDRIPSLGLADLEPLIAQARGGPIDVAVLGPLSGRARADLAKLGRIVELRPHQLSAGPSRDPR